MVEVKAVVAVESEQVAAVEIELGELKRVEGTVGEVTGPAVEVVIELGVVKLVKEMVEEVNALVEVIALVVEGKPGVDIVLGVALVVMASEEKVREVTVLVAMVIAQVVMVLVVEEKLEVGIELVVVLVVMVAEEKAVELTVLAAMVIARVVMVLVVGEKLGGDTAPLSGGIALVVMVMVLTAGVLEPMVLVAQVELCPFDVRL